MLEHLTNQQKKNGNGLTKKRYQIISIGVEDSQTTKMVIISMSRQTVGLLYLLVVWNWEMNTVTPRKDLFVKCDHLNIIK